MRKVALVTGASGWVGGHCLAPLIARGYEVHGVRYLGTIDTVGVTDHQANLFDHYQCRELLESVRPTHLFHFAWYVGPNYRQDELNWSWLGASIDLVSQFFDCGGERFIGAGTCLEYDWSGGRCTENNPAVTPSTPYGRAKLKLFQGAERIAQRAGGTSAWGRIFFSFGPRESPNRLIPSVTIGLLNHERVACSEGNQVRDFIYIEDLGDAFSALGDSVTSGPINMAGPYSMTIRELVTLVSSRIETRGGIDFGARHTAGEDAVPWLNADIDILSKKVGWRPKYSMEEAIDRTVSWWRAR